MLSNDLNTNEVKNSSGTEVEFQHLDATGRKRVFAQKSESYALPHRLTISHADVGTGQNARRRSVVRIDKTIASTVDATKTCTVTAYLVADIPTGAIIAQDEPKNVIAEILSFCATTGAATTVLFDCTGNGAAALLNGSL